MSGQSVEAMQRETRGYVLVFVALMALTVITVAISRLHVESLLLAVGAALLIAVVKGSLVACYFMHLISERKLIYWVLLLTVVFFVVLMFLPLSGHLDSTGG